MTFFFSLLSDSELFNGLFSFVDENNFGGLIGLLAEKVGKFSGNFVVDVLFEIAALLDIVDFDRNCGLVISIERVVDDDGIVFKNRYFRSRGISISLFFG
ncbi:hypothetical protein TRFO_37463 [Tritrichomonas foetus]|uniref:Uncharacterized protein n=1 Tax=Tritrichomonas foetus TaxID=1144522 RepID=A0A1J4JB29_9EUKA|nr:hypothetical protein TRFO_37463 [Tritrichomonas foetus]|eukprot:OHS96394.1 hypothetical protein TRFO_37463 [Tritrichomonas foetus]